MSNRTTSRLRFTVLATLLPWLSPIGSEAAAPITAIAFSRDSTQVVVGSQAGIEVRSWPQLELIAILPTQLPHVHDLSFSPDGQTLLVAGGLPSEYGTVEVFSWPQQLAIASVSRHDDVVYRVAWSPNGNHWATAGADGICQIFLADTRERLVRFEGHSRAVLSLAYLPDGASIVSVGVDQTLQLWDAHSGQHRRTLDNHLATVNQVAVRPGPSDLSAAVVATISEDRTLRLWQPTIGRLVRFARLPSVPRTLAWTHDGHQLLVGCDDGRVRVVDPDQAQVVAEQPGLDGRIYELVLDPTRGIVMLGGQSGYRSVSIVTTANSTVE